MQTYLSARKAAAKPFYDAYAKLVRSQSGDTADDDNSNQYSYLIKQAGGSEKILKRLSTLVGGASPRALARDIAKGKPNEARAAINSLIEMMKDDTPENRLYAVLEGAADAENPKIRVQFLEAVYQVTARRYGPTPASAEDSEDGEDDDNGEEQTEGQAKPKQTADRKLQEAEIKVWRDLLADTRDVPNNRGEKATIGDLAASILMFSINPGTGQAIASSVPILQKTNAEVFREHATARLDGKTPPVLPDPKKVKPDRLKAIVSDAASKPPAEIHPYLKTLTPDERAAWLAWLRKPGDIPIPKAVKDLSFLITARSESNYFGGDLPDVKGAGLIDVGFAVTAANLKTYIESLAKDPAKHSRTFINIYPAPFGPGLQVFAMVLPLAQPAQDKPTPENDDANAESDERNSFQPTARDFFRESVAAFKDHESAEAVIMISISKNRGYGEATTATWLIEKGQAKPQDPDQQSDFDDVLKSLTDSNDFTPCQLSIQILTKADADKIQESNKQYFGE